MYAKNFTHPWNVRGAMNCATTNGQFVKGYVILYKWYNVIYQGYSTLMANKHSTPAECYVYSPQGFKCAHSSGVLCVLKPHIAPTERGAG